MGGEFTENPNMGSQNGVDHHSHIPPGKRDRHRLSQLEDLVTLGEKFGLARRRGPVGSMGMGQTSVPKWLAPVIGNKEKEKTCGPIPG